MQIKVLGAMDMTVAGRSYVPSAAKPRQVLALLALRAGEVVPVDTLIEEVWGDDPPRSALTTLQTYILHLRRCISSASDGADAKQILATRFNGYTLDGHVVEVDADRFRRLVRSGLNCMEIGDQATASRTLSEALALWSGQALVDLTRGASLSIEATSLEHSRMSALEARIEADLELGRHQMLLGELPMLVARHPMNESLCEKLMLALYRSGQQWRALNAFQELRKVLTEELGIEPSPRLQSLQQAMLARDLSLEPTEDTTLAYAQTA